MIFAYMQLQCCNMFHSSGYFTLQTNWLHNNLCVIYKEVADVDNCDGSEETLLSLVGVSLWTKMLQIESQSENVMKKIDLIQSFSSAVERRTNGEDEVGQDNELHAIKQKIDDVEAKIESKMQRIGYIDAKMGDVEAKIDAKMDDFETKMVDVEAKIDAKMDVVETKLGDVEAKIESKMQRIGDIYAKMGDVEAKIDAKMDDFETKMGDIKAEIDTKMRDVEAKIESKMQGFEDMMSKLIDMMGGD